MLVIDNGSDTIKIGFSGEDMPRIIYPSISAIEKISEELESYSSKI
jgi:actin-related protein